MPGPKTNERPGTRASARHVRGSASKVRRVLNAIRNESVEDARTMLQFMEVGAADIVSKVLESAVANAFHNDGIDDDELFVSACYADEGVTIKRFRPRARGRASRINKRTTHLTIIVSRYESDELEARRERQAERGGTSAAQAEARRRRVQRSQAAAGAENDDNAEDDVQDTVAPSAKSGTTDLTDINGIGPKFAESLQAAGIGSIAELAAISDDKKAELAEELKGDDIDDWVEQAKAMANSEEEE